MIENDLIKVITTNDGVNVIESREVAKMIGKEHKDVLRMIDGYEPKEGSKKRRIVGIIPTLVKGNVTPSKYFVESSYSNNSKEYKCYLCTKMGCEMIANKLTGEKGILFSAKYVEAFNEMQDALEEVETTVQTHGVLTEKEWNNIKKKSKYLTENIHSGKSTRDYIKNCDLMHLQDVIDEIYEIAKPCRGEIKYEILNSAIKTLKEISSQYDYSNAMSTFIKTAANDGVIKLQSIHAEKLVRETNNKDRKINDLKSKIDEANNNILQKEKELLDIKEKYDPNNFWTTLDYHPFSVNYMYDDNQITDSYQRWIDNFPKNRLHSKEEYEKKLNIDFSKPIVIYIKYRNLPKFDTDNLSKSLIDYIFNRHFLVDDSIVKGKVEFTKEHCDSYADGKIKFTLRNMTDDEINRLND